MDDVRYQDLMKKRDTVGLSLDEANELGRMMAEKEGKTYSGAGSTSQELDAAREDASTEALQREEAPGFAQIEESESEHREGDAGILPPV